MIFKGTKIILVCSLMLLIALKINAQSTFVVTTTTDPVSGPGSVGELRWAIEQANLSTGSSIISFNISGTGPFTITPNTTLPVITKQVFIDGTTQPGYDFNDPGTPMIIIDGTIVSTPLLQGIAFNNAPGSKMAGIYIREFTNGLSLTLSDNCEITNNVINRINQKSVSITQCNFCTLKGNYINTDKALTSFSIKSVEGIIFSQSNDNIIGGTNCGEGNTIAYVTSEGIDNYPITGQRNLFSGNIIFGCTLNEIFLRTTGNGGKTYPTITSTGCTVSGTAQSKNTIQVFGSTGASGTRRNARVFMGSVKASAAGSWSLPLTDIQYPFVVATATDTLNNTSELCPAVAIAKDTLKLLIANSTSLCVGEEIVFENTASKCQGGLTYVWDFGDGSSASSSSSHIYSAAGTYTVTVSVPEANNCASKNGSKVINVTTCGQFDCAPTPPPCGLSVTTPLITDLGTTWTISVTASGGTPPYTYLWFDPITFTGLLNTTTATVTVNEPPINTSYGIKVTVTDSAGCSVTKIVSYTYVGS